MGGKARGEEAEVEAGRAQGKSRWHPGDPVVSGAARPGAAAWSRPSSVSEL